MNPKEKADKEISKLYGDLKKEHEKLLRETKIVLTEKTEMLLAQRFKIDKLEALVKINIENKNKRFIFQQPISQVPVKELTEWAKLHAMEIHLERIDSDKKQKDFVIIADAL